MIELASYDIWRTLFRASKSYSAERARLVAECFGMSDNVEIVKTAVNDASNELDDLMDKTGLQYGFMPRIQRAAVLVGVTVPSTETIAELEKAVALAHLAMPPSLTEEVLPELFRRHKQDGRQIAVISNTGITTGKVLRQLLDKLGLLEFIDYEFYSDELGVAKPNPKVFELLARTSGVSPESIIHIGDNLVADREGAENAGMHGLHYLPSGESSFETLISHWSVLNHPLLASVPTLSRR